MHNITPYLPLAIKNIIQSIPSALHNTITEIRMRINNPLCINTTKGEYLSPIPYIVTQKDINFTVETISNFSLYAFENELKNGYITIPGGHRVGICGQAVLKDNGHIQTLKNFSAINFRVCKEIIGAGNSALKYIVENNGSINHTMIISPPACGKTTMLRDIIRSLSYGDANGLNNKGKTIGVVDERSEIAGTYQGIAQNNLGPRTDVLDACPKALGMIMLLRSMAPQVIAVDELGQKQDIEAVQEILNSGVKLICTVHGSNLEELKNHENLSQLLNKKVFDSYIILGNNEKQGKVKAVYNKEFVRI